MDILVLQICTPMKSIYYWTIYVKDNNLKLGRVIQENSTNLKLSFKDVVKELQNLWIKSL